MQFNLPVIQFHCMLFNRQFLEGCIFRYNYNGTLYFKTDRTFVVNAPRWLLMII